MNCRRAAVAALLLALIYSPTAFSQTYVIAGKLLDVESGKWHESVVLTLDGERISSVSPLAATTMPSDADVLDLSGYYLVPGLIDAHVHLHSGTGQHGYNSLGVSLPAKTLHGAINAKRTLEAGFTTVRQVGAPGFAGVALRDAINRGELPGPRMRTAGPSIGITGGHCSDNNLLPFDNEATGDGVADGPWAMRRLVRRNKKFGADVIKTCSTGGVLSKGTEVGAPQGTLEELTALVEEAHSHGLRVAVHAHGATGIRNAIEAGADSIEHASFIDDEGIRRAKARGTFLVMDIYNTEYILGEGVKAGILEESLEKERRTGTVQRESFRRAHKAGVRMAFGSDAGVYPHGQNARQLSRMTRFGMTEIEALRAATLNAAELLDMAKDVGQLKSGYFADFVVVSDNPLENISTLEAPRMVVKGGHVVKEADQAVHAEQ